MRRLPLPGAAKCARRTAPRRGGDIGDVTILLQAAGRGDAAALGQLFDLLYADLRRMAHARLRDGTPEGLHTTALVHETFLRLVQLQRLSSADRPMFLAYVGRVMRSIIVDAVRRAQAERRGGGALAQTLNAEALAAPAPEPEVLRVHEALQALEAHEERLARVVELRYFAGLEMDEIAETLGVAKRTAERDWARARIFLRLALK